MNAIRQKAGRLLSAEQFPELAEVPDAAVWLAIIDSPNTPRAYPRLVIW